MLLSIFLLASYSVPFDPNSIDAGRYLPHFARQRPALFAAAARALLHRHEYVPPRTP